MKVSDEARKAAADFCEERGIVTADQAVKMRAGSDGWDNYAIVQAFARFEAEVRKDEREQIRTWLGKCSGSYRAKTVADAIGALEHKDAMKGQG